MPAGQPRGGWGEAGNERMWRRQKVRDDGGEVRRWRGRGGGWRPGARVIWGGGRESGNKRVRVGRLDGESTS